MAAPGCYQIHGNNIIIWTPIATHRLFKLTTTFSTTTLADLLSSSVVSFVKIGFSGNDNFGTDGSVILGGGGATFSTSLTASISTTGGASLGGSGFGGGGGVQLGNVLPVSSAKKNFRIAILLCIVISFC